jgi:hypothetical protein
MDILALESPGEIFSGKANMLKSEYDSLLHKYHPDKNKSPNAHEEFVHLQKLHELAKKALQDSLWETRNKLLCGRYHMAFHRKLEFPLGKIYIGDTHLTFLVERKHEVLWNNALKTIKNFKYPNDKMKQEMSRYLPSIRVAFDIPNYFVLVLNKTPDLLLLRDIPTTIPDWDRHVAWIISTLHNFMCYLEFAGLTHNDISLDTYFISPEHHSGALLGGWWYSCKKGEGLTSVPKSSYELFSPTMKKTLIADHSLDKELLRALGRELLGDRSGTRLLIGEPHAPLPIINWLKCATSKPAVAEYKLWDKVLQDSYGKKRFIPMDVSTKTIYK